MRIKYESKDFVAPSDAQVKNIADEMVAEGMTRKQIADYVDGLFGGNTKGTIRDRILEQVSLVQDLPPVTDTTDGRPPITKAGSVQDLPPVTDTTVPDTTVPDTTEDAAPTEKPVTTETTESSTYGDPAPEARRRAPVSSLSPVPLDAPHTQVETDQTFTGLFKREYDSVLRKQESLQKLQNKTPPDPSSSDIWGAAFSTHNSMGSAIMREPMPDFEPVEGYDPFAADANGVTEIDGYEEQYRAFSEVSSPQETSLIKQRIDREKQQRKILNDGGSEGLVASIAAGVADPINLALLFVPLGQTRMAGAITGGAVSAFATEAALQGTQETRTAEETALTVAASAIFSGLLYKVSDTTMALVDRGQKDLLREQIHKHMADTPRSAGAAETARPAQSAGAEIIRNPLSIVARQMAKITPLGRTIQSESAGVRAVIQDLAESAIRVEGDFVPTAVESLVKLDYARLGNIESNVRKIESEWIKTNGADRTAFSTQLTSAMRTGDESADPLIQAAIAELRPALDDMWKRAADAKIPNTFKKVVDDEGNETFEPIDVSTADSYLTRRYDVNAVRNDPEGHKRAWMEGIKDQHGREYEERVSKYIDELAENQSKNLATKEKLGKEFDDKIAKDLKESGEIETPKVDDPELRTAEKVDADLEEIKAKMSSHLDDIDSYADSGELTRKAQARLDKMMDTESRLTKERASVETKTNEVPTAAAKDPVDYAKAREDYITSKMPKSSKLEEPAPPKDMDEAELYALANDMHNNIINLRVGDLHFDITARSTALQGRVNVRDDFVMPYLVKDWEEIMNGYYKSMGPKVRMAEKFGDGEGDFLLRNQLDGIQNKYEADIAALDRSVDTAPNPKEKKKAVKQRDQLITKLQADMRDIEVMRDRVLNLTQEASWMNPENRGVLSALRTARSWNVATMLSNVVVSSVPDLARAMTYNGAGNFVKAFAKSAFTKNIKRSNMPSEEMARMASAMERASSFRLAHLTEVEDGVVYTRADKYAHYVADKAMSLAGIKHWNSLQKTVIGYMASDKMARHLLKGTGRKELSRLGITDEMYDRAAEQARKYSVDEDGLMSLGVDRWENRDLIDAFEAAAIKEADTMIVTPSAGDKALFQTTEVGRTLFQFKSFMVAATNRMMLPLLQEKGIRPWIEILTHVGLGAGIYSLRETLAGREVTDDPAQLMIHSVDATGLSGYALELMKMNQAVTGIDLLGLDQNAKYHARGPWGTILGPSAQQAQNVWRAGYGLPHELVGKNLEGATAPDTRAKALRKLMPMQNHYLLKSSYDKIEEGVAKTLK